MPGTMPGGVCGNELDWRIGRPEAHCDGPHTLGPEWAALPNEWAPSVWQEHLRRDPSRI